MSAIRAVRMTAEHLGDVAELERLCFGEPWSEKALTLLTGEEALGFVCLEDGHAVAYGGMMIALDEGQVTNVATHPDHRRRGLGRLVLDALLEGARARNLVEVTLEVREGNAPAIALYQSFGFEQVGYRPRFYTRPVEAALLMRCLLH